MADRPHLHESPDGSAPKAPPGGLGPRRSSWSGTIGERERRKLRARQRKYKNVWFGFSIFGLIGWSVALPAILGVALGQWIDRSHPGAYSWTLMLMFAGLAVGCLNAWNWMRREREAIDRIEEDDQGHE